MQLITISKEELAQIIRANVRAEIEIFKQHFTKFKDDDLVPRKEAARILKIDVSTLWEWTTTGKLIPHRIGRKVYYKRSENAQHFN